METKFSKGVFTRELYNIGIPYDKAYNISKNIEDRINKGTPFKYALQECLDKNTCEKYYLYKKFKKEQKIILIGGGTGVGTSSLSIELANRLNIYRVVGTDSIREVLRKIVPKRISPELHASTYEAWKYLNLGDLKIPNIEIVGFRKSVLPVHVGIEAILERVMKENVSVIIEGVHILPDMFSEEFLKNPNVYFIFLGVENEEDHKKRFFYREMSSDRKAEKYLKNFETIRKIHDYILEQAKRFGFPIIYTKTIKYNAKVAMEILLKEYKKRTNQ